MISEAKTNIVLVPEAHESGVIWSSDCWFSKANQVMDIPFEDFFHLRHNSEQGTVMVRYKN